jgi:hypothetical protein
MRLVSKTGQKIEQHEGLGFADGDRQGFIHCKSLPGGAAGMPRPGSHGCGLVQMRRNIEPM